MRLQSNLLLRFSFCLSAAASVFAAAPRPIGRSCGAEISTTSVAEVEKHLATQKVVRKASVQPITIGVHWHVISADGMLGAILDSQIASQIDVLNTYYAPANITWALANTTRIVNENWFHNAAPRTPEQAEMKAALRQGGPELLNVYSTGLTTNKAFPTFPWNYASNPSDDGIVLRHTVVPGGGEPGYDHGKTLVHESGHWVGLFHTYQNGCDGPDGDFVDDTPAQLSNGFGCTGSEDTCPGLPGLDLVHNPMNLDDDACMSETFTPGQIERLRMIIATYRGL